MTNGADVLARTLADHGIDTCFANPGTTEMHLLAALGREGRIRSHLCVFEGVATGAADGFARMAGRPAVTLLHLGPGLANGMANLHNARKASSSVLNLVGDHATYHLAANAPLAADIEGMARTVSDAVERGTEGEIARQTAALLARIERGGVATLVVPNDVAWAEAEHVHVDAAPAQPPVHDPQALAFAGKALSRGKRAMLLLGAPLVTRRAAELAQAIGERTGCRVFAEAAVARMQRGGGAPALQRLPFHVDPATKALKSVETTVLIGARAPVAFFAYPGRPSHLLPEKAEIIAFAQENSDIEAALEALANEIGAKPAAAPPVEVRADADDAPITAETLGRTVARRLTEDAIVIDESITNGGVMFNACGQTQVAHDWLNNRGGSIGYSMPVAIGAAVACPDRKVLCVVGDGSALYTFQSLWTMARSRLDVTVVVLANRSYRILENEMSTIGAGQPTDSTTPLMSLENPAPDWVKLAEGQGVGAERVADAGGLDTALRRAFEAPGPHLIEAVM